MRVVGLMSGTSMDGIDAALIDTDGEAVWWLGPELTIPYDASTRALLEQAMADARGVNARTDRPGVLAQAERRITDLHAEAVRALLVPLRLEASDIDLIGFHGQTVLHRPDARLTVQIGEGARLASALGVPVVADFRAADVAAGGEGAPLVPVFHAALAAGLGGPRPLAVLNVGGVSNVTVIGGAMVDGAMAPIACDTGPGNALLDDFMMTRTGRPFDADGAAAARGTVDESAVAAVLEHPFFRQKPPKSLDRNAFRTHVAARLDLSGVRLEDGAATLTAVTAASIAAVVAHLPVPPRRWIVAGGGARNPTLLAMLEARLGVEVVTAAAVGWSGDALEAHAFGFLAARAARGLPLTFPTTTGVPYPLTGGVLFRP
ncbi:anhydro-N-acetylmuramic acid kinase [Xanthobacter agilis]|uniref:Anhydro-N-acetylmuramic acid kinase n=1 Tax=Xanthobacter agilis TaxID=47492 RepID=A0ABU0LGH0_XANAG|nr:anhydro-N-acetylmuramic acid kinase [Xanthobacter agilis]MDQ0506246.1 anhydro-N-acetylmuramic acid kinase [Xanthobacter agilis]